MWSSLGAHAQPTLRAVIECGFFSGSAGRQVRREVAEARTPATGETARAEILDAVPTADVTVEQLDLADFGSVHAFADRLTAQTQTLELLLNNAGVMAVPTRMLTVDGFELQFATNYLGPFALTNRLLPLLLAHAHPDGARDRQALAILRSWNFDARGDLGAPAIFEAWFLRLAPTLAGDELGVEVVFLRQRQLQHHGLVAGQSLEVIEERRLQLGLRLGLLRALDVDLRLDDGHEPRVEDLPARDL